MGADWTLMIDRAADIFDIIKAPAAILFGIALGMGILDWVMSTFGGGGGGGSYADQPAAGAPMQTMKRPGRGGGRPGRAQRPPTWRDEDYFVTNSWDVLEDRARTVNGYRDNDDD